MTLEPEELRAEQRWSSIPQQSASGACWPEQLDERLLVLVTNATVSDDRFPVGVNWLEISRSTGYSPLECVKRYAFLHASHDHRRSLTSQDGGVDVDQSDEQEESSEENDALGQRSGESHAPFSGLSSSDENLGSPSSRAFLEYGSPLASPGLQSLEISEEFGGAWPSSPPPFALREPSQQGATASSPFRWENVANEANAAPILKAPPHMRQGDQLRTSFGVSADDSVRTSVMSGHREGTQSPRIVHGTQSHSKFTDPNFASDMVHQAFKGLNLNESPPRMLSPRLIRTISNSEYPFLKEDDRKSPKMVSAGLTLLTAAHPTPAIRTPPTFASPRSTVSSLHNESPFSGSLTQSALEDAFLDMAGSRLDASSMLFASRLNGNGMIQSRSHPGPSPPLSSDEVQEGETTPSTQ